jgi:hypothetical protein
MINIIKIKEEWKLILESDLISDKNIENKQKQANENPNKSKLNLLQLSELLELKNLKQKMDPPDLM